MTQQEKIQTDIIGIRYGKLIVISYSHKEKAKVGYRHYYNCKCDCGNDCVVERQSLGRNTKSCGCIRKKQLILRNKNNIIDLEAQTKYQRLYRIWGAMKNRCYSSLNKSYRIYGGKGVVVCDEWHDWFKFKEWAITNGYDDTLTIDRINSNGNYEPNNCRWTTCKEQSNNISTNKMLTYKGRTQSLAKWCDELNLPYDRTKARLNTCHMTVEQAFELPFQKLRRKVNVQ